MNHMINILVLALALCGIAHANNGNDAILDAALASEAERMREAGIDSVPVNALPEALVRSIGLKPGSTITIEQFTSPQFQEMLLAHGAKIHIPEGPPLEVAPTPEVLEAAKRTLPPGLEIVTDPKLKEAFRQHQSDPIALRAAVEPVLSEEFQLVGEARHAPNTIAWERRPTAEVLEMLRPSDRDLLSRHKDLLDDHWRLMDAMPSMSSEDRAAARRFIARLRKPDHVPLQDPDAERWRKQGYREVADAPRGSVLLAAVKQIDRQDRESGHLNLRTTGRTLDLETSLSKPLPHVPRTFIMDESQTYTLPGGDHSIRLYSHSTFGEGALLMVEQSDADAFHPRDPNLTVAGYPGMVGTTLHGDGSWSTTVAGFDGGRVHHVTVEAKLEGAERDAFIRFAVGIIEESSLLR